MLLNYAPNPIAIRRLGPAILTGLLAVACGAVTAWCVVHVIHVQAQAGPIQDNWPTPEVGLPAEITIALGLMSAGCAIVAAIQAIRFYNGAKLPLRTGRIT